MVWAVDPPHTARIIYWLGNCTRTFKNVRFRAVCNFAVDFFWAKVLLFWIHWPPASVPAAYLHSSCCGLKVSASIRKAKCSHRSFPPFSKCFYKTSDIRTHSASAIAIGLRVRYILIVSRSCVPFTSLRAFFHNAPHMKYERVKHSSKLMIFVLFQHEPGTIVSNLLVPVHNTKKVINQRRITCRNLTYKLELNSNFMSSVDIQKPLLSFLSTERPILFQALQPAHGPLSTWLLELGFCLASLILDST